MKSSKKLMALVLSLVMAVSASSVCMAQPATADTPEDQKVFVTFVYGGNSSGEWVIKGTNVTAPEVPVLGDATFCGWSAPLTNIQTSQQIYAIYKPNYLGEAAIEAAKKSLPTPAISATRVADPNAAPVIALPASVSFNSAAAMTPQQQQMMLLLMAQQQTGKKTTAAAATTSANTAAPAAAPAAQTPAATAKPANNNSTAAAAAAATAVQPVKKYIDKDGNEGTFTQKEWDTLLNVYGGSEEVLRKHSLGDLKKIAAYYGG